MGLPNLLLWSMESGWGFEKFLCVAYLKALSFSILHSLAVPDKFQMHLTFHMWRYSMFLFHSAIFPPTRSSYRYGSLLHVYLLWLLIPIFKTWIKQPPLTNKHTFPHVFYFLLTDLLQWYLITRRLLNCWSIKRSGNIDYLTGSDCAVAGSE